MEKITLDADAAAKLDRTDRQVVLTDASGRMLGYFLTPRLLHQLMTGRQFDGEPTPEELEAAREDYRKNGGYTTAEVLAHLADLGRWYEEHRG
jgi:hypothetical protein